MKKIIIFFVCAAFTTHILYAKQFDNSVFENYQLPSSVDTNHTNGTWGAANNGLIAKIWTETMEFQAGESIVVYYIVKNISDEEIITWHSGFWPNHLIVVTMPDGNKVTSKDMGLSFDPGGQRSKNALWLIKPNEIDNALSCYDISKFFAMDKPGVYFVQYLYEEYQGGWEGKLWSNISKIKIIK
ncbi:MAG: hypothetical protein PHT32_03635 [Candidatus Omnitrophica bacterium]|nr:hypothetical protein [Candidatus Omnitrophota bacterium]